jgi:hypothetical protein
MNMHNILGSFLLYHIVIATFLCIPSQVAGEEVIDESELTIKGELPSIRTNYANLQMLVKDIEELVNKSLGEQTDKSPRTRFTYQVKNEVNSLQGNSLDTLLGDRRLPDPADGFSAYLQTYQQPRIYIVDITFVDWRNTYRLVGTDKVSLEAIQSRLISFGQQNSTLFGGFVAQSGLFAVFVVSSLILISNLRGTTRRQTIQLIAAVSILLIGVICFLTGVFANLLPRTAIYKGSDTFWERYSAAISFWSFVIGLVGLVLSAIPLFRPRPSSDPK